MMRIGIICLAVLGFVLIELGGSRPIKYGVPIHDLEVHDGFTVSVIDTCRFLDGSTQIQKTFQFDNSRINYPSCTK